MILTIYTMVAGGSGAETKLGLPSHPDAPGADWGGQEEGEVGAMWISGCVASYLYIDKWMLQKPVGWNNG